MRVLPPTAVRRFGLVPAATYGPARRLLAPRLAGIGAPPHIALTFDDGPDPVSTPRFLDLLARHRIQATFFVVGERAAARRDVVRRMVDDGHEVAVHGWHHRCVARLPPARLRDDLARTLDVLHGIGGDSVTRYRPPYGVMTVGSRWAANVCGLSPLLWSAWGRDWSSRATPSSVERTVWRTLRPGGTVLLHDTDAYAAPGSWRVTLAATERLLRRCTDRGWPVGPAAEH